MLKSQLTNTDDDTHSFMTWLSLVYLTMIPQVLVYVSLRFRPNAVTKEQMAAQGNCQVHIRTSVGYGLQAEHINQIS